jgi:hypothetical protein
MMMRMVMVRRRKSFMNCMMEINSLEFSYICWTDYFFIHGN